MKNNFESAASVLLRQSSILPSRETGVPDLHDFRIIVQMMVGDRISKNDWGGGILRCTNDGSVATRLVRHTYISGAYTCPCLTEDCGIS